MLETYIISPLVGALVVWLAQAYGLPYIRGAIRSVSKIRGSWNLEEKLDDGTFKSVGKLEIQQFGTRVRATNADPKGRTFSYKGIVSSGQVVLTFEQKGGAGYNLGSMVMKLSSDLNTMNGKCVFWKHDDNMMKTEEYIASRSCLLYTSPSPRD